MVVTYSKGQGRPQKEAGLAKSQKIQEDQEQNTKENVWITMTKKKLENIAKRSLKYNKNFADAF